jgi:hypothetical protein
MRGGGMGVFQTEGDLGALGIEAGGGGGLFAADSKKEKSASSQGSVAV